MSKEGPFVAGEDKSSEHKAKELAKSGKSVLVNVRIGKTNFRKGSISM